MKWLEFGPRRRDEPVSSETPNDDEATVVVSRTDGAVASVFEHEGPVSSAIEEYETRQIPPVEAVSETSDRATLAALAEVTTGMKTLADGQEELRQLFDSRLRSDEAQAKTLERLHDQVLEYKSNFVRQEMQPLLRDLIYCYDYAADEMERAGKPDAVSTPQATAKAFDHLRQMIADVLAKYDIEPYRVAGDGFDRKEQQCVRTVSTNVPGDEKKIAGVGAVGFRRAEMIVRKEQVMVYKYTPDAGS